MSGSLTNKALEDSIEKLGMRQCTQILEPLDRPNISYEIKPKGKPGGMIVPDILSLVRYGNGMLLLLKVASLMIIQRRGWNCLLHLCGWCSLSSRNLTCS
jgi:hypothetical protein